MKFFRKKAVEEIKFFELSGDDIKKIECEKEFSKILETPQIIQNIIYYPDRFPPDGYKKIEKKTFKNVSLSKKNIENITFNKCIFDRCLFIGTHFKNVEFHNCRFINCNLSKIEVSGCYWDPKSISYDRIYFNKFSNVGVSAYQALMKNATNEDQPDHKRDSDIQFRRWKRYQLKYDHLKGKFRLLEYFWRWIISFIFQKLCGFGYKPLQFGFWTLFVFLSVSIINMFLLTGNIAVSGEIVDRINIFDSIYYTFSILMALGFSDVIPVTTFSKLLTVFEAFLGITWIAVFIAVVIKRVGV